MLSNPHRAVIYRAYYLERNTAQIAAEYRITECAVRAELHDAMKALQRIDQSVDAARNRLTALEDISSAAKALYGRLTPEQQSLADTRLATTLPTGFGQSVSGVPGPRTPNL